MLKKSRLCSLLLVGLILVSSVFSNVAYAKEEPIHLTILGTTDMHGNLYNWSYEDNKELDDRGMTLVHSAIEYFREQNPNTILIDNGDTVQGTILTDDLFNTRLDLENPIISAMNFMGYDSMTLGNHEFNFGIELIEKIKEEADFPILAANAKYKKDGSYLAKPWTIVDANGLKVGIIGATNPQIPRWDASKVVDLEFENMADSIAVHMDELKKEADIIIATAHAGLDEDHGDDSAREIAERFPELSALMVGHSHGTVKEEINGVPVGGARDAGKEIVKFDLFIRKDGDNYEVVNSFVDVIQTKNFKPSEELLAHSVEPHEKTLEFISEVLGVAADDFQPENEIKGIPEAQLRDTALIDLINNIQLKEAGADVSAAALFQNNAKLKKGDINYADIFNVYKFPNTIYGVEVTGEELKDYMEWSVKFYRTWKPGDINISFNEDIRGYRYDMFQGVDYKIDLSKPEGERIVDLKFKGEDVKPTDSFKLAVNNFRYDNIVSEGLVKNEPYFKSDPKALRSYIADYIQEKGTIEPVVDNNWEIVGVDLDHPYRDYVVSEINKGNIELPKSEDGRSINIAAINIDDLIEKGLIPEDLEVKPEGISIRINKEALTIPAEFGEVFIEEGRTMVPVRAISEGLGHEVEWDRETRTAIIDGEIKLAIGEKEVLVGEEKLEMDVPAQIIDGRTYLPLRFVSEALGYEVKWDKVTRTVTIVKEEVEVKPAA